MLKRSKKPGSEALSAPLDGWGASRTAYLVVFLIDSATEFDDLFPNHIGDLMIHVLAYNIAQDETTVALYKLTEEIVTKIGTMEAKLAQVVKRMIDIANRELHAKIEIDNTKAEEFHGKAGSETLFKKPLALVLALPALFHKCYVEVKEHIRSGLDSVELLDATAYALQGFSNEDGKETTHDSKKKLIIVTPEYLKAINEEMKDDLTHLEATLVPALNEYKTNAHLLVKNFHTAFQPVMAAIVAK